MLSDSTLGKGLSVFSFNRYENLNRVSSTKFGFIIFLATANVCQNNVVRHELFVFYNVLVAKIVST